MAVFALVALAAFAVVAFGWRIWLQLRRTGDTGLRGSTRTPPEVLAGLVLLPGAMAVVLAPVADLLAILSSVEWLDSPVVSGLGIVVYALGFLLTVRAQLDMGASWRIGVDVNEQTSLVTHGVFRFIRNPIYSGMVLAFAGVALVVPNLFAFIGMVLVALGLEIHVRYVEEPYLSIVHGQRYRGYAASAGRFLPAVGRFR